ncbi:GNAT family N-acetyltransferase [Mucilaginibacter rubeus]|uniref:GNAT family N-acetyltransferase n=1 Tax=Mucilaginibacter rubeus TaxID=2027860 RepID=A0AAE6JBC0_9SPHI|nr:MULTISPECIES: GNAT family N-acetyltransferase [Mucilaginibacter]QEM02574.1 GNAT family N-acetyltransferase [Mucilaginibacter rubeus]QEM15194.1 GNAT family N-acetyltransferase [Mucilaginibacter gossypii]QTE42082.1 GNAT family N-acetyltransferase [Mucilaginibacter rubeus]QTE48683.1 GNAT family N-acetyltransferase [Mucilaginibacter rubeus]QTE60069.1 GNAT family N-acetyltransferase [Mucilaginibacter rubeus]
MTLLTKDTQIIVVNDDNFKLVRELLAPSIKEGYAFVQKTMEEWENGASRFNRPGEQLYGLLRAGQLTGIGGLSYDPYIENPNVGRVRHLYIRQEHRRKGYGRILMENIIHHARQHFITLRLFTDNPDAYLFYETLGFMRTNSYKVSHILHL